jgi:hypothetical protein
MKIKIDNNNSNVVRSADYKALLEKVDAPFGKVIKRTIHPNKKNQAKNGVQKHKGKNDW